MNIKKVKQLIELIEQKNTGEPIEIAKKLSASERQIYNYLELLKTEFNSPIEYSRTNKTFFFTENDKINLNYLIHLKVFLRYNSLPKNHSYPQQYIYLQMY